MIKSSTKVSLALGKANRKKLIIVKNIYKYKIVKDIGLVIQFHKNDLTIEGAKRLKLEIIHDTDYEPNFSFLIDLRKANYNFTEEELENYGNFVSEKVKLEGLKRVAILTETPEQVVKTTIYTLNKRVDPTQYKIFSTLQAAICWLQINPKYLQHILSEINKLEDD